jgi:hypothetical protein
MRRYVRRLLRETIVCHLKSGESLRGVLVGEHSDVLVFEQAMALSVEAPVTADGLAIVPRANISWMQQLLPAEDLGEK